MNRVFEFVFMVSVSLWLFPSLAVGQQFIGQVATDAKFKIEVIDESFSQLVDPNQSLFVVADGFDWSEGPVWDKANQRIFFSDVPQNKIYQIQKNQLSVFLTPSGDDGPPAQRQQGSNGLLFDAEGFLVVCDHGNRRLYRLSKDRKQKTTLTDQYESQRFNSPNDLTIKSNGDLFFTDPPYGLADKSKLELDFNGVYCLTADGQLKVVTKKLHRPNGVALSPDEKTLYVAQSHPPAAVYMKYAINNDGSFGSGEILYDSTPLASDAGINPGLPDGMAVDVQGNLWATGPGGVLVISPAGKLLGRVYTGKPTANCTFVDDGFQLLMTADDQVLRIRTKVCGLGDWGPDNPNLLIPIDVVTEISREVTRVQSLVQEKDYQKLVETVVAPLTIQQMKDSGEFAKIVEDFGQTKVAALQKVLDDISFVKANYSPKKQTVVFECSPRKCTFKKTDLGWKLQN